VSPGTELGCVEARSPTGYSVHMLAFALYLLLTAAILAVAWWARRRSEDVDDYYEREWRDPPVFDAGGHLGGSRF